MLLGVALVRAGLGIGATMMPTMAAAYQTLAHAEVPRATTALNIVQRGFGALGVALISVILANQFADRLPGAANAGRRCRRRRRSRPPHARRWRRSWRTRSGTPTCGRSRDPDRRHPASMLPRRKPAAPQPVDQRADEAVAVAIEV